MRRAWSSTPTLAAPRSAAAALPPQPAAAEGYSNLEYDLEAGERGSRHTLVTDLLRRLTGAEDALVANNNAAALLLVLSALGQGREAIISRGQLVEIGGGFRIPDVMRQSGVSLVEVGTTNRTYAADFEAAITDRTALLLRVHASNFLQVGFVHQPALAELVEVGRRHDAGRRRRPGFRVAAGHRALRPGPRADGPGQRRRRRDAGGLLRRQAAGRPAGRHRRRPRDSDRPASDGIR